MSEAELAIWRAAYAAAFADEYARSLRLKNLGPEWVERNRDAITEFAVSIADEAVAALRDWRVRGRADAGIQLSKYHLKKG